MNQHRYTQKEQIQTIRAKLSEATWRKALEWLSLYAYSPAVFTLRYAVLDKPRWLQKLTLADRLFHELLAAKITEASATILSDRVFSYRKGRGRKDVLSGILSFLKAYRRKVPEPKMRRLFALRLDVANYTDSIPVGDHSPLWSFLRAQSELTPPLLQNLKAALQAPVLAHDQNGDYCMWVGVPTGSPLTPLIANLYLSAVDRYCETLPQSFYARYGDDIVFLSESEEIFDKACAHIQVELANLSLSAKAEKVKQICWSGSGAKHNQKAGAAFLDILGIRIEWGGQTSLPDKKIQKCMRELSGRLHATLRLLRDESADTKIKALCLASNDFYDPQGPFQAAIISDIKMYARYEPYFRRLDYLTAKMISELISNERSSISFRKLSWKTLIRHHGWKSPYFQMRTFREAQAK